MGAGEDHAAICKGDDVGMLGPGRLRSEEAGGAGGDQRHQQPPSGRGERACGACRDIYRETPLGENVSKGGECEHQGRFRSTCHSVQRPGHPSARRSCRGSDSFPVEGDGVVHRQDDWRRHRGHLCVNAVLKTRGLARGERRAARSPPRRSTRCGRRRRGSEPSGGGVRRPPRWPLPGTRGHGSCELS